ncbi:uncharacterized protein LOC124705592 isoform X3 [Lolium rigidum]|uniref:uncharacterized protein LOC124705592 isoform X3 n=1 Tax=Lolium rigidum TaxID=89674 RepID=UPI001F5C51F3|nr:uncharacterized protein LOC124705592 isoform X3 [Lolium rigidum]
MRSTAATCAPAALAENLAIFFGRALQARGWRRHLRRRGAGEVASDPWRAGEDARFLARIGMHDFIWPTGCPNQRNKAYGYWGRCEGRWSPVLLHLLERIYEDTLRKVAWSLSLICHVDRKFNENPSRLHVKSIKEVTEVSAVPSTTPVWCRLADNPRAMQINIGPSFVASTIGVVARDHAGSVMVVSSWAIRNY